jgi:hypothetical protein
VARPLLADGRGYDIYPATEEELVSGLLDMDAKFRKEGEPRLAVLFFEPERKDTARLSIGLGEDESTLTFDTGDLNDAGAYSKGARAGDKAEVGYAYGDGYSEFYASTLVPKQTAIAAAREFFRTGRRPATVQWEEL